MPSRVSELNLRRTERSKTFLRDDGEFETDCSLYHVHFSHRTTGALEEIVVGFIDGSDGVRPAYMQEASKFSVGLRKDKLHSKMFGCRLSDNHQYEVTPVSVLLDGIEQLSGTVFDTIDNPAFNVVTHGVNADCNIHHRVGATTLVGYIESVNPIADFTLEEEIHLKGFHCGNDLVDDVYQPTTNNEFHFYKNGSNEFAFRIVQPRMWDSVGGDDGTSFGINHTLEIKAGPHLIYTKTPTAEGVAFLQNVVGSVFIDTSTDFTTNANDGYIYYSHTNWTTCRDAATGSVVGDTQSVNVCQARWDEDTLYYVTRAFMYFDTSAVGGDTITSADLILTRTTHGGTPIINVFEGTQGAGAMTTADYDAHGTTELSTELGWESGTTKTFSLNAAGLAAIDGGGNTFYCMREIGDYDNVTPSTQDVARWDSYDGVGTPPKLTVIHGAAGNPYYYYAQQL